MEDPDSVYECDAPQYIDFELIQNGLEDPDTNPDEWFNRCAASASPEKQDKPVFEDTFVPPHPEAGPSQRQPEKKALKTKEEKVAAFCSALRSVPKPKNKAKGLGSPKRAISQKRPSAMKAVEKIHHQLSKKPKPMKALAMKEAAGPSLAMPKTPEVVKRYKLREHTAKAQKTSEELELEKIGELKKETERKLLMSKKSFKRARRSNTQATINPVRSSKPTTEPISFQFRTEERVRKRQGFRERGLSPNTSAEFISKFPTTLRGQDWLPHNPAEREAPTTSKPPTPGKLTVPKTPQLQARTRSRPVKVLGFAEQEELQVEEMNKYKFKAQPVNKEIFTRGGHYGLKQLSSDQQPSTTIAQSPFLATKLRSGRKRAADEDAGEPEMTEPPPFKANPVPRDIFEKVKGVPEKQHICITNPQSPGLRLKKRRLETDVEKKEEKEVHEFRAKAKPDFTRVFKPQLPHVYTDMQPFSFEGRYPTKDELVTELARQEEESAAEKREFYACPMPDLQHPPSLPPKLPQASTKPEPFRLMTQERGEEYTRTFSEKMEEELQKEKKMAEFKASDVRAIYSQPFVPSKSMKPLTESSNIALNMDLRLEKRAVFDEMLKKKEEEREREEAERRALQEAEEAKRIKELRRSMVHKAQPIQHYQPISIHPSLKPATVPVAPFLTSGTRLRNQMNQV